MVKPPKILPIGRNDFIEPDIVGGAVPGERKTQSYVQLSIGILLH
jgi:hypothetical protein